MSECSAGPRGGDAQPGHLSHSSASATGSQSVAACGDSAMQHPAGTKGDYCCSIVVLSWMFQMQYAELGVKLNV